MPKIDGVSAIAVVLIASFAVDRIATAILFLLAYAKGWRRRFPDPALQAEGEPREKAASNLKLAYFCIGAVLAIFLLAGFGKIRIMAALGFPTSNYLDIVVTGLILIGGADRVAELLKTGAPGEAKSEPKPITITGKLVLEDGHGKVIGAASGSD